MITSYQLRGPILAATYTKMRAEADEEIARRLGYPSASALARRLARQSEAHVARRIVATRQRAAEAAAADPSDALLWRTLTGPQRWALEHGTARDWRTRRHLAALGLWDGDTPTERGIRLAEQYGEAAA